MTTPTSLKFKKIIVFFVACTISMLMGCSNKQDNTKAPDNLIPKEKMIAILIDIHIADNQAQTYKVGNYDTTQAIYYGFQKKILEKHKVDSLTYQKSYTYYLQNIAFMDEIYATVVDSLSYRGKIKK